MQPGIYLFKKHYGFSDQLYQFLNKLNNTAAFDERDTGMKKFGREKVIFLMHEYIHIEYMQSYQRPFIRTAFCYPTVVSMVLSVNLFFQVNY